MVSSGKLGFWWLPDSPERTVPGTFMLSEDGSSSLDIIQSLHVPSRDDQQGSDTTTSSAWRDVSIEVLGIQDQYYSEPLIHGRLATGEPVTLKDCLRVHNFVNPVGGFPHSSYKATITFIDSHFERTRDILAERLILRYTHLSEWAQRIGDSTIEDDTVLTARYDDCELRLRLPGKTGKRFGRDAEIVIEFPDSKPLEVLVETADRVQDLLTYGMRSPVHPLKAWMQSGPGEEFTAFSIYFPWRKREGIDEVPNYHEMLFSLDQAPRGFSRTIERWMGCYHDLRPLLRLYFGMAYIPPGFLDQKAALLLN